MANVDKLEEAMRFILDNPEKHNQEMWTCETGACIAGWGALLNGFERSYNDEYVIAVGDPGDHERHVPEVARKIFGITEFDASILFDADNTVDNLQLMVKTLVDGDSLRDNYEEKYEHGRSVGYYPVEDVEWKRDD